MPDWITGPLSVAWHLRWILLAIGTLLLIAVLLEANHRLREQNRLLRSNNISLRAAARAAGQTRGPGDRAFGSPRKASGL